jgi:hypothetical protein
MDLYVWTKQTEEFIDTVVQEDSDTRIIQLFIILLTIRKSSQYNNRYFFYEAIVYLAKYSVINQDMIEYIAKRSCWKDLIVLWKRSPDLRQKIDIILYDQFRSDQESEIPSLLAKWLPREKSDKALAIHFSTLLFPLTPSIDRLKVYRKTCSYMNRILDTTEIKMCSGNWSSIHPDRVPNTLFRRSKHLFLNGSSTDKDRVRCYENFNRRKNT